MGEVAAHNDALTTAEKAASAELETKLRGAAVALARDQFGAISGARDSDLYTARLPGAPTPKVRRSKCGPESCSRPS